MAMELALGFVGEQVREKVSEGAGESRGSLNLHVDLYGMVQGEQVSSAAAWRNGVATIATVTKSLGTSEFNNR